MSNQDAWPLTTTAAKTTSAGLTAKQCFSLLELLLLLLLLLSLSFAVAGWAGWAVIWANQTTAGLCTRRCDPPLANGIKISRKERDTAIELIPAKMVRVLNKTIDGCLGNGSLAY